MTLHPLLQRQQHLLVLAIERCALPLPTKKVLLEVLSASAEAALQQQTQGSTTIVLWCQIDLERWAACLDLEPLHLAAHASGCHCRGHPPARARGHPG